MEGFYNSPEISFFFADRDHLAALDAFYQNLDIAIGLFEALNNVGDGTYVVNFIGAGFVDGGVVLGGQEDFLVARERFLESPDARFASHDERGHHVRENDDVPYGHHG